jgi:hypothetical protein
MVGEDGNDNVSRFHFILFQVRARRDLWSGISVAPSPEMRGLAYPKRR